MVVSKLNIRFSQIMFSIIVPYRDRPEHLEKFLSCMQHELPEFGWQIIIVEQIAGKAFNRGKLLNIGFLYVEKQSDYVVLHDVDMLPENADYSAPVCPTHIATQASQFAYLMPYPEYFGGVTLFPVADFRKINGFSNTYWGWGGEDDDLRIRCKVKGLAIASRQCRFQSLSHPRNVINHEYSANVEQLNLMKGFTSATAEKIINQTGLCDCSYKTLTIIPWQYPFSRTARIKKMIVEI